MIYFDERPNMMEARTLIVFILVLPCLISRAWATETSWVPNPTEIRGLPTYCQVKFNAPDPSPERREWEQRIGKNFLDIHHYCAALNSVKRYWRASDAKDRSLYLEQAMTNFNYMVKAEKPDFLLRGELYSSRGETFKLMGRKGEAIRDFNQAISIDPKMARPYLQLADLYVADKKTVTAQETITEGLRHNPDSKALQRRYLELGGKKPFPQPVVEKVTEPDTAQKLMPESSPPNTEVVLVKPAPSADQGQADADKSQIGTPGNPYCRFCPPQ